jgi:hypothetical protein
MPLEHRHLETYQELFCHRRDLYALQRPNGAYFLKQAPLTPDVVRAHLVGTITAGFYALTPDNTTRWVVLDADREDGLAQLQWSAQQLDTRGINSHFELSRRGGHLWILFEPIQAKLAKALSYGLPT